MWTMTIPVLSTAHITQEANDWLSHATDVRSFSAAYEGGYFIFADLVIGLHEGLDAVLKWAQENKHDWIRLDRDGDVVPELPQYEW